MIVAVMIGYCVLAIGLIGLVGYLTGLQNIREMEAATSAAVARMRAEFGKTPPLEPYVREPLSDSDPPEMWLLITIGRHPESGNEELSKTAVRLIRVARQLDQSLGGDGLRYDPAGSVVEPTKLVLRLVPSRASWDDWHRLEEVARGLIGEFRRAREGAVRQQDDDIRKMIERELHPPLPTEFLREVEVAVGPVMTRPTPAEPPASVTA